MRVTISQQDINELKQEFMISGCNDASICEQCKEAINDVVHSASGIVLDEDRFAMVAYMGLMLVAAMDAHEVSASDVTLVMIRAMLMGRQFAMEDLTASMN